MSNKSGLSAVLAAIEGKSPDAVVPTGHSQGILNWGSIDGLNASIDRLVAETSATPPAAEVGSLNAAIDRLVASKGQQLG